MRSSKNVLFVLTLIVTLSFFCACNSPKDEIVVYSTDYPGVHKLTAGEVDLEEIKKHPWSDSGDYWHLHCSVSKGNNYDNSSEMLILEQHTQWKRHKIYGVDGFLFGEDNLEHMSGVFYCPDAAEITLYDKKVVTLLADRCVGLYCPSGSSGEIAYAVTAWNYWSDSDEHSDDPYFISLYKLEWQGLDEEFPYHVEKVCDISLQQDAVATTITEDDTIYVLADTSIFEVTLDGSVREIPCPTDFYYYGGDSIVELDGQLFIGCYTGILRCDIKGQKFTWFPVDYEKILTEK